MRIGEKRNMGYRTGYNKDISSPSLSVLVGTKVTWQQLFKPLETVPERHCLITVSLGFKIDVCLFRYEERVVCIDCSGHMVQDIDHYWLDGAIYRQIRLSWINLRASDCSNWINREGGDLELIYLAAVLFGQASVGISRADRLQSTT